MAQETSWFHEHTTDEAQEERHHLRIWVMRILALLAALGFVAWATKAYAAKIIKAPDGDYVRLHEKPCESATVLALVIPQIKPMLKHAAMQWKGKPYQACWLERDGNAIIIDEAADITPIPLAAFREEGV